MILKNNFSSKQMLTPQGSKITIHRPDDFHVHFRTGSMMKLVAPHTAQVFARALVMPNTLPPIINVKKAKNYFNTIKKAINVDCDFKPMMTLYLTDQTTPTDIIEAKKSGMVMACKLYPAGATTNSAMGVSDIRKIERVLEEMQKQGLILCIHAEVTDANVDIFDREKIYMEKILTPLVKKFSRLKTVMEHVTTKDGVDFIKSCNENVVGTITVHHLMCTRTDLLGEGIKPHLYCKPVLKSAVDRAALIRAATESNKFFAGTDSAPHTQKNKESACGCAGIYTAPIALQCYAQVFDEAGMWDISRKNLRNFEDFVSARGAKFYNLQRTEQTVTLKKKTVKVPKSYPVDDDCLIPFKAGEVIMWSLV